MKQILFIFLLTILSLACQAQTKNISKNDSSKFNLKPFQYYYLKSEVNNSIIFPDYAFDFRNRTRFTLYQGSIDLVLYNNYRHEYFLNDPIQPYSNFQSALLGGSLNYLFQLFQKKK